MQATPTPFRTYPVATLWHEADGLHIDQPARILRCLKLATSYMNAGHAPSRGRAKTPLWRDGHNEPTRELTFRRPGSPEADVRFR